MAVPLDWSVRISEMEALLVSRQSELQQQLEATAALEACVETEHRQRENALLEVLQLNSKHADASLRLAQLSKTLSQPQPDSSVSSTVGRLEKRYCRLQRQAQAMRQAQQKEQQMMQEFGALAEEHVSATAAPLREARRALGQAQAKLQDQKRLSRTLPALEAECAQLNVVAEALAEERQTAGRQLDEVQAENKALQRLIDDQRAVNNGRTQAHQQAEAAKTQARQTRVERLQQESKRLRAEEQDLDHKLAECRAELLDLSALS